MPALTTFCNPDPRALRIAQERLALETGRAQPQVGRAGGSWAAAACLPKRCVAVSN